MGIAQRVALLRALRIRVRALWALSLALRIRVRALWALSLARSGSSDRRAFFVAAAMTTTTATTTTTTTTTTAAAMASVTLAVTSTTTARALPTFCGTSCTSDEDCACVDDDNTCTGGCGLDNDCLPNGLTCADERHGDGVCDEDGGFVDEDC